MSTLTGHVDKDRAPPAPGTRQIIMTDHDDEVVETILPPKPFGARGIRVSDRSVVVTV